MEDWQYQPAKDLDLPLTQAFGSLRRESGLAAVMLHHLWWGMARTYLKLYHRLTIQGRENLPVRPPYVLIANHASHLDAIALAAAVPMRFRERTFPIAAGDVFFETPVVSMFAAMMLNALPLWRRRAGRHAMADLRQRLIEDQAVYILFPEGARSRTGQMAPFKPGIGMLIAGTPIPIIPCRLEGAYEALKPESRLPRPRKITLAIGRPLVFERAANERAGWETVSDALRRAVEGLGEK